ncbi:DUF6192 family protein [Streptomyces sp. NPDC093510]|uniref:DUF6192 family protein n=1 Tax=Streptomyces sp. NPDC093510 TaxID=3155199 RepID=UPI0034318E8D
MAFSTHQTPAATSDDDERWAAIKNPPLDERTGKRRWTPVRVDPSHFDRRGIVHGQRKHATALASIPPGEDGTSSRNTRSWAAPTLRNVGAQVRKRRFTGLFGNR